MNKKVTKTNVNKFIESFSVVKNTVMQLMVIKNVFHSNIANTNN